jgi:hypothetical protein
MKRIRRYCMSHMVLRQMRCSIEDVLKDQGFVLDDAQRPIRRLDDPAIQGVIFEQDDEHR